MILVLGKNGYVSSRFQDFFKFKKIIYSVVSISDLTDLDEIEKIIKSKMPDLVINCVGYTGSPNIAACEANKEECLYVNVMLAGAISEACGHLGVPMAHVSTGCVYSDPTPSCGHPYAETTKPNFTFAQRNTSWYSGTKALGEEMIMRSNDKVYIWRIRMPFNHIPHEKNIITKYMMYPKILISVNSYTNLDEFVSNAYYSVVRDAPYGIYNMTNPGGIDTQEVLDIGRKCKVIDRDHTFITESEFDLVSKTPRSRCILDTSKIEKYVRFLPIAQSFNKSFRHWGEHTTPFWL